MDQLIYINDYYDGPLSGITSIGKNKYFFIFPFSEKDDAYESIAKLYPIDALLIYGHLSDIANANSPIEELGCDVLKSLLEIILEKSIFPIKGKLFLERTTPGITAKCFSVAWTIE
jgi:hypothetical protein